MPAKLSLARRKLKIAWGGFTRRVTDLILSYMAVGRLTPELRREVFRLKIDIDTWRARTGRDNIKMHEMSIRPAARKPSPSLTKPWDCGRCDLITFEGWTICFLVGCEPKFQTCYYACIGPTPEPGPGPTNGT